MSNEPRDQLAAILAERQRCCPSTGRAQANADAVIAAGWRPPPRVIETLAELEARPEWSIVRWVAPNGLSRGFIERFDGAWWQPGNHVRLDVARIPLPATLVAGGTE